MIKKLNTFFASNQTKNLIQNLIYTFLSILVSFGIFIDLKIEKSFNNMFYNETGIFALLIVLGSYYILKKIHTIKDKRLNVICACLGTIFALCTIFGITLNQYDDFSGIIGNANTSINEALGSTRNADNFESIIQNSSNEYENFGKIFSLNIQPLKALMKLIGISVLYFIVLKILFIKLKNISIKQKVNTKILGTSKKAFIYCSIILFLSYLPYLLHYFPGLYHIDARDSIAQIVGMKELSNHHPVFYTLYVGIFINIGKLFNNYNLGIALHSIFQMIMMSFTFSYIMHYMAKLKIDYRLRLITFLLFAFLPMNANYAISISKDTPFTLAMSIMMVCMIRMCLDQNDFFKNKKNIIIFTFSCFLVTAFRNNGIYILLILFPILLVYAKKFFTQKENKVAPFRQIIISFIVIFSLFTLYRYPLFSILNVKEGSSAEALSIPLQQFARITKYEENHLTNEEKEKINYYLDYDSIATIYNGKISDKVKATFKEENFKKDKLGLFQLYFQLFLKYPRLTMEAFFDNNYGYWYPDVVYWKMFREPMDLSNSIISSLNIEWTPIVRIDILYYCILALNYANLSFVTVLISPGFMFWMLLICISYMLYRKQKGRFILTIPLLALWLTCIASPVYAMFRYIYPLYVIMPFLIGIILYESNDSCAMLITSSEQ
ncbi:MAG: hypothetical protein IJ220_04120 [Clostridia bacterium]|nr:hypothetical protein [Clostridia bacterium]